MGSCLGGSIFWILQGVWVRAKGLVYRPEGASAVPEGRTNRNLSNIPTTGFRDCADEESEFKNERTKSMSDLTVDGLMPDRYP